MIAMALKFQFSPGASGIDPKFLGKVNKAGIAPVKRFALRVKTEAQRSMLKGGKFTHKITRGKNKGKISKGGRPSEPGRPPNVQIGNLRGSITHALFPTFTGGVSALVGPTRMAWYGKLHEQDGKPGGSQEFGGRNFPARPFMLPALRRIQHQFPGEYRNMLAGVR